MSKQQKRRQHRHPARGPAAPSFTPVPVRERRDGWTAVRQDAFIRALAETACVEEACAAVGMSPRSVYTLRCRPDAASFRQAWDIALDYAVGRLADAVFGRALNGVATPVFYKGEQIGERRRYDERLATFILRTRAPDRFGKWLDGAQASRDHPDGAARTLGHALRALAADNLADVRGEPRPDRAPLRTVTLLDDPAVQQEMEEERARREDEKREAEWQTYIDTLHLQAGEAGPPDPGSSGDVARTS